MRIAVVGASGFVGRALSTALAAAGHQVIALARHRPEIPEVEGREIDVSDEAALEDTLAGCAVAFYLVHSLGAGDFRARDRQLAEAFNRAAHAARLQRVVYLGGLGQDPDSEHLVSRQEVGTILADGGVPVVELRAAVVLGAGSISFEMLRYLTERLPFMVCPRWVRTAIQPIALVDMIRYLVKAIDVEPGIYEIGGAEVTSYRKMIDAYAMARGLSRRYIFDVPYLTPRLSSYWLDLVTPVDRRVSHALIESLATEVVVHSPLRTDAAFDIAPLDLAQSLSAALDEQVLAIDGDLFSHESGLNDGVYAVRIALSVPGATPEQIDADLARIGGSYGWYGLSVPWRIRAALGRLVREFWSLSSPPDLEPGAVVDWWTVVQWGQGSLVLRAIRWFPGEAWLGYRSTDGEFEQVGAMRPKGIPGFLYWKLLQPVHRLVFEAMARHRVLSAESDLGITGARHERLS